MVEKHNITQFYTAPTAIRTLMRFSDEKAKVPVKNLMGLGNKGKEDQSFASIRYNFNHERWFIEAQLLASCRGAPSHVALLAIMLHPINP